MIKKILRKTIIELVVTYAILSIVFFSLWLSRYYNKELYVITWVSLSSFGQAIIDVNKMCKQAEHD